jgi:hypothetical protein
MTVEFAFAFQGDEQAAERFLQEHGAGTGLRLSGQAGLWRLREGLEQSAYAADVWSQLRLFGETEWLAPEKLWEALMSQDVGAQQVFQWLGVKTLQQLPAAARLPYDRHPPVSLSLEVDPQVSLKEVMRVWQEHPLFVQGTGWMMLRPWGRGHGLIVEAHPFAPAADAEVFFIQIRDLARMVPLRTDRWGFRSVRAWLPLSACHALMRQIRTAS